MENRWSYRMEVQHAAQKRRIKSTVAILIAILASAAGVTLAIASLETEGPFLYHKMLLPEPIQTLPRSAVSGLEDTPPVRLYQSEITRSTDSAGALLKRLNIFDPEAQAFLRADPLVRETLLGQPGRNVSVESLDGKTLLKLTARWGLNDYGTFKRLMVEKGDNGYHTRIETLRATVSTRLASGTIRTSLFAATDDANIPDSIALQLTEIFSGDIDFHRSLRKDDRFAIVYETIEDNGELLRVGRVLSAEFVNAEKTYQAMWFPGTNIGEFSTTAITSKSPPTPAQHGGYYTFSGESLRRPFLVSPLKFSRVSNGFKMRLHPIFNVWRAHRGVDYAAPSGTPVRSVGNGIVKFAGTKDGLGKTVVLEHRNGYATVYAHLSQVSVRSGQRVDQGQYIGRVGATGWATGPHLHFEFHINGVHHDPMTIARKREPTAVSASAKPMFDVLAARMRAQLAAASQLQGASAQ